MDQNRKQNRRLTDSEQQAAKRILESVRSALEEAASGDRDLIFALRRYVFNRLMHDERGKPMLRRLLKLKKIAEQMGLCAICQKPLPKRNSVLDRHTAVEGYNEFNTRVLCPACDASVQAERNFS